MKSNIYGDYNRAISAIFSIPTFKEIFKSGYSDYVIEKVDRYRSFIGIRKNSLIKKIVSKAYTHLTLNYRNEYVYKNTIANKLLLERHNLNEANIINELRIGGSIADLVIINGTNTVYEIKTELDSPDKLKKQVEDYKKISPKIYLVTHHTLVDRYAEFISNDSIGLISLSPNNDLKIVIEAGNNTSQLNNKMMMDTLRREEYSSIIQDYYGTVPQVSNIKYYKECSQLIDQIVPEQFHSLMLNQLRKRIFLEKQLVKSNQAPFELKHICLSFNPNKTEFENLNYFLNLSI